MGPKPLAGPQRRIAHGLSQPPAAGQPAPFLPVKALQSMVNYQASFTLSPPAVKSNTKAFLVIADGDAYTDPDFAKSYVQSHFAHANMVEYLSGDNVGHYVDDRVFNPQFSSLVQQIEAEFTSP